MCKKIFPKFFSVSLLLSQLAENAGDYTIREFSYRIQDTTAVVWGIFGIRIVCKIIAVSNPGYRVYTIYASSYHPVRGQHTSVSIKVLVNA